MRSPNLAMLWEMWRLTRGEAAWRLAVGIVAALAALVVSAAVGPNEAIKGFGAVIAMILLVLPHLMGWLFLWRVGTRPGFPLYLLYTRPVRTAVMVCLPLAYLTAVPAAIYLVSALLMRATSGYSFSLLPVAAWIAALNLILTATKWSIRNRVVQTLVGTVASGAWTGLGVHRLTAREIPGFDWPPNLWPTIFDLPLTDYAMIGAIGLASFGLTIAAVARQRHGDAPAAIPWTPGAGFPERLVSLFRLPCPTSSPTRAQLWFELRSRGLPLLAIGGALAVVNPLLFAVSGPIDAALFSEFQPFVACRVDGCFYARPLAMLFASFSLLTVLALGGNGFGIRWLSGRRYTSAFEATQPYGTGHLAGLKVLVRSVCHLAALIAIGVSVWISLSFITVDKGYVPLVEIADQPLDYWQRVIEGAVGAMSAYQQLALAVVVAIGVVVWVAAFAVLGALRTRYFRRLNIAASLLLLYGLALALLALAGRNGIASAFLVDALFTATRWSTAAAMVFTTAYLFWSGFAQSALTMRHACGALVISAAFGAAWVTVLRAAGMQFAGMPTMDAVWILSPTLLPLLASVLAPWSLNRIRHI